MAPSQKFTHAEHRARAMLLDKIYDWRNGTYATPIPGSVLSSTNGIVDAITLEPMSQEQVDRRIRRGGWPGYTNHSQTGVPRATPYADE